MTPDALQPFCHDDPDQPLGRPWSIGDFTYASNKFVIIRVPLLQAVASSDLPIHVSAQDLFLSTPKPTDGWVLLSETDLGEEKECSDCHGEPRTSECPECDGRGSVTFWNEFHEYECDCQTCAGKGEVDGCKTCGGRGVINPKDTIIIKGSTYTPCLLRPFAALPNARIATDPASSIAWIEFDGGDGLVARRIGVHP